MYPGDPALSASSYDNTLTASAGYPGASSVDTSAIDWTALGCLPSGELAGNYLESQGSAVDSPGALPLPFIVRESHTNMWMQ
jgi:hypothetical protein